MVFSNVLFSDQSYNMAKEKPRLVSRGDRDFTRYLFLILTTFDHIFDHLENLDYTEYTDTTDNLALFVKFGLQNRTIRTKKDVKNAHGAVGAI